MWTTKNMVTIQKYPQFSQKLSASNACMLATFSVSALPQRVNLSLELGTLVWFSLSFILKVALKTLDFKLSFRFPPPQVTGLNVVVGGWGGMDSYF